MKYVDIEVVITGAYPSFQKPAFDDFLTKAATSLSKLSRNELVIAMIFDTSTYLSNSAICLSTFERTRRWSLKFPSIAQRSWAMQ